MIHTTKGTRFTPPQHRPYGWLILSALFILGPCSANSLTNHAPASWMGNNTSNQSPLNTHFTHQDIQNSMSSLIAHTGNEAMKTLGENYISGEQIPMVVTPEPIKSHGMVGNIYYISPNGDDDHDGLSPAEAWQTVNKVNQTTFQPGDRILFKAGGEWIPTAALHPLGSGTETAPIVIGAYGNGPKPKFSGKNINVEWTFTDNTTEEASDVLYLENQQYIEIRDLDISNAPDNYTGQESSEQSALRDDRRGIHIVGGNNTTETELDGFWLHDLYIHDVAGEGHGVGGTGWDPSKRTAGILFEIIVKGSDGLPVITDPVDVTGYEPTYFSNVLIEHNVLVDNSYGGIIIKQLEAWGARDDSDDTPYYDVDGWYPNTYITIENNYLDNYGSDYAADTIYLTTTRYGLIKNNVSHGAGTSAIELYYTDSSTVEYNEVYGAVQKATGSDSNAIDPDKETTNALIQYNYLHNNGDGILLCGLVYGTSVIRYNVIQDSDPAKLFLDVYAQVGYNFIYNNIFYNSTDTAVTFVSHSAGAKYLNYSGNHNYLANNIFYSPNVESTTDDGKDVSYMANAYYNVETVPDEDTLAVIGDPQFVDVDSITGGEGQAVNLEGLRLLPTSPLINGAMKATEYHNTAISAENLYDFGGLHVNPDTSDIGLFEFTNVEHGQHTAGINGHVYDDAGTVQANAQVTAYVNHKPYNTTTDENGFYVIYGLNAKHVALIARKSDYLDSDATEVDLVPSDITPMDLILGDATDTDE